MSGAQENGSVGMSGSQRNLPDRVIYCTEDYEVSSIQNLSRSHTEDIHSDTIQKAHWKTLWCQALTLIRMSDLFNMRCRRHRENSPWLKFCITWLSGSRFHNVQATPCSPFSWSPKAVINSGFGSPGGKYRCGCQTLVSKPDIPTKLKVLLESWASPQFHLECFHEEL